ncbi:MAG: hypothetical protein CSB55_07675 [Candidatus Cloacimonadota bacterium]|nr:MAG: hypothetical protein CSB55_07675 [Candidatus Cloacimonadota bacterium]
MRFIALIVVTLFSFSLFADPLDEPLKTKEEPKIQADPLNEPLITKEKKEIKADPLDGPLNTEVRKEVKIVEQKYNKKNALRAVALSALFPGAGQFYVDKSYFMTYIYPVVEIALWTMSYNYNKKGDDETEKYENFANGEVISGAGYYYNSDTQLIEFKEQGVSTTRYSRGLYKFAKDNLLDEYEDILPFSLDDTNTQHFYEDIGKYNKYVFGWHDWFNRYYNGSGFNWQTVQKEDNSYAWVGNIPNDGSSSDYETPYSAMRAEYNKMRAKAEDYYSNADWCQFGILLNHAVSAFDALRVTKKYNQNRLEVNLPKIGLDTRIYNSKLVPMFTVSAKF